ncbi:MAG: hypothetical protein PUH24_00150 [Prevotellaceae bacterium]|nr:hypothetical protein [Prevotella sp.]MDD7256698.1 hypothetical protein [Prevotellaceae bacterium]MDY6129790.1 hypothetical protein [Prevotella sp.]
MKRYIKPFACEILSEVDILASSPSITELPVSDESEIESVDDFLSKPGLWDEDNTPEEL